VNSLGSLADFRKCFQGQKRRYRAFVEVLERIVKILLGNFILAAKIVHLNIKTITHSKILKSHHCT
jgi:hypothetical protein